jgi:hypothetical protein
MPEEKSRRIVQKRGPDKGSGERGNLVHCWTFMQARVSCAASKIERSISHGKAASPPQNRQQEAQGPS